MRSSKLQAFLGLEGASESDLAQAVRAERMRLQRLAESAVTPESAATYRQALADLMEIAGQEAVCVEGPRVGRRRWQFMLLIGTASAALLIASMLDGRSTLRCYLRRLFRDEVLAAAVLHQQEILGAEMAYLQATATATEQTLPDGFLSQQQDLLQQANAAIMIADDASASVYQAAAETSIARVREVVISAGLRRLTKQRADLAERKQRLEEDWKSLLASAKVRDANSVKAMEELWQGLGDAMLLEMDRAFVDAQPTATSATIDFDLLQSAIHRGLLVAERLDRFETEVLHIVDACARLVKQVAIWESALPEAGTAIRGELAKVKSYVLKEQYLEARQAISATNLLARTPVLEAWRDLRSSTQYLSGRFAFLVKPVDATGSGPCAQLEAKQREVESSLLAFEPTPDFDGWKAAVNAMRALDESWAAHEKVARDFAELERRSGKLLPACAIAAFEQVHQLALVSLWLGNREALESCSGRLANDVRDWVAFSARVAQVEDAAAKMSRSFSPAVELPEGLSYARLAREKSKTRRELEDSLEGWRASLVAAFVSGEKDQILAADAAIDGLAETFLAWAPSEQVKLQLEGILAGCRERRSALKAVAPWMAAIQADQVPVWAPTRQELSEALALMQGDVRDIMSGKCHRQQFSGKLEILRKQRAAYETMVNDAGVRQLRQDLMAGNRNAAKPILQYFSEMGPEWQRAAEVAKEIRSIVLEHSVYANRFGGSTGEDLISGAIRNTVATGLEWLRKHQDDDGRWDADNFMKHDKGTLCDGPGNSVNDIGVTGLALLAFLGSGNTCEEGPYRDVVNKGIRWLVDQQREDGLIGMPSSQVYMYSHAVATLAICEAYGLSDNYRPLKNVAQNALNYIAQARNTYGVWRYQPRDKDSDTSITGWMVQAMLAGREFNLKVDEDAFKAAKLWFDNVTDPVTGQSGYQKRGEGCSRPVELVDKFPAAKSEAMTAVVLLCRALMHESPKKSPTMDKAAEAILKKLPTGIPNDGSIDMYYWYYASSAMFQYGGNFWGTWSLKMTDAIMKTQRPQADGNFHGSWDPVDPWGQDGGRVYSTAMMVLALEAPIRHTRVLH